MPWVHPGRVRGRGFPAGAEALLGHLVQRAQRHFLGVVNQDVDAPEMRDHRGHALLQGFRTLDVADHGHGNTAALLDVTAGSRQLGLGAPGDGHFRPGRRQRHGDALPHSLPCARYQGNFAIQFHPILSQTLLPRISSGKYAGKKQPVPCWRNK